MTDKINDTVVGLTATGLGTGGLTVQVATQYASLAVIFLNILLALGGLYLLWPRIKKAYGEKK